MTVLDQKAAFTGDGLRAVCAALGLTRPLGLAGAVPPPPSADGAPVAIDEHTATALAVLARPDAIAVIERAAAGRVHTTYVAACGADAAVHRIQGDRHIVDWCEREEAAGEVLAATGLAGSHGSRCPAAPPLTEGVLDVTRAAYERMAELVAAGDLRRGAAALASEGVEPAKAGALAAATRAATVYALGLRSFGVRYEGCELAWVGDDHRWLVPLPSRDAVTAAVVPRLVGPRHVRARIEPVTAEFLTGELVALFA